MLEIGHIGQNGLRGERVPLGGSRALLRRFYGSALECGASQDDGLTLVELLIAMAILPLIMSAIAFVIITSLTNDTGISTRLSESHDAQITSAYFVRDVESTGSLTTSSASTGCGAGNQVLGLEWQRNTGTAAVVSYVIGTIDSKPALKRNFCSGSTTTVSTIAEDLASLSSVTVTLTCNANFPSCATAAAAGPTSAGEVATIEIQATEASGYVYTLTAAPREVMAPFGTTAPGGSVPTMLLLGSGTDVNCAGSGHGTMTLDGIGVMDSSQSGTASFGQNYDMTGADIYSGSSAPVSPSANYITTSATPTQTGPPLPDPYANVPDPSISGPIYTTTNTLPGPGIYTNAVTIANSSTLLPGVYVFEQGFATGGNPSTSITGNGVLFFIGIPNAPPGTVQTASYSVAGNSTISLSPMTSAQSQTLAGNAIYGADGIVIFQSRTDSQSLYIAGNGGSATYGGVIYAPDATVNTAGGGATSASSIIANSLTCGGNAAVTIGTPIATTTKVSASPSNPASGHSVTLTASVTGDGLSPLGSVTFTDTPSGSSTATQLCSAVSVTNGTAACTATLASSGSPYSIVATFNPYVTAQHISNFASSNGSLSLYVAAPTSTVVSATPSSPSTGSSETFTATVSPAPDAGTVTWTITYGASGTRPCDIATPLAGGTTTCTVNAGELQAANSPYTVTAVYSGDPSYQTSTGTLNVSVSMAATTTTGKASAALVPVGSPITDTATVTGSGPVPTGQVQFYVCQGTTGCTSATSIWSTETLAGGSATSAQYVPLNSGSFCFAAYYGGSTNYATSSDTTADQCFTVTQAASATTASPSVTSVPVGSPISDTATVTGPGAVPTGQVQFYVCQGTTGCTSATSIWSTETLAGGSAISAQYVPSNAGSYCFAAYYGGDPNYIGSSDTTTDQCFTAS